MKFKNSTLIILWGIIVAFVLRTLQIFLTIDQSTGFYKIGESAGGTFLTVAVAVLCIVVAFVARNDDVTPNDEKDGLATQIAAAVLSISLFYEFMNEGFVLQSFSWQVVLMKLFGLLTAVYFAARVVCPIFNFTLPQLFHTLPSFYMIIRIICSFISISSLSLIAENVFLVASYCCALLFFVGYASQKCELEISDNKVYMRSVLAFSVCFVTAFPNLIMNATSLGGYSHISASSQAVLTAMSIFIAVFTYKKYLK